MIIRVLLISLFCLAAPVAGAGAPVVLVMGDSLSAGYGMSADDGWVALLQEQMQRQGYRHKVVNASVSGETTRGGLARLPRALERHRPDVVVIELGGNDGLRGLPVASMRANLDRMISTSLDAGARVLITEIRIPPNYGPRYTQKFRCVYFELAAAYNAGIIPGFIEDVARDPALMQADGIHPNRQAQPLLRDRVWRYLEPLLDAAEGGEAARTGAMLRRDAQQAGC